MTIIDDFYRQKEIIDVIQAWQPRALTVVVNNDKKVVEVGLCSNLNGKLTSDEIYHILVMIQDELVPACHQDGEISIDLTEKLHEKLKILKNRIKKDFDLKEVK